MLFNTSSGQDQLKRLKIFTDVVYAITFWKILEYLPHFESMLWVDKRFGLLSNFIEHPDDSLRMGIGLALVIMYWIQSNKLLSVLERTDTKHSVISIIQLIFVCLFVYFTIADPYLKGRTSTMVLQSISLAIAGLVELLGLKYAAIKDFIGKDQPANIVNKTIRNVLPEPITATINIALALCPIVIWTLAWIVLPLVIRMILKKKVK